MNVKIKVFRKIIRTGTAASGGCEYYYGVKAKIAGISSPQAEKVRKAILQALNNEN